MKSSFLRWVVVFFLLSLIVISAFTGGFTEDTFWMVCFLFGMYFFGFLMYHIAPPREWFGQQADKWFFAIKKAVFYAATLLVVLGLILRTYVQGLDVTLGYKIAGFGVAIGILAELGVLRKLKSWLGNDTTPSVTTNEK